MLGKFLKRCMAALLCIAVMTAFTGCGSDKEAKDGIKHVKSDYSESQMYILMGSMKKAVTDSYTQDVFSAVVDSTGATYEDKFLEIMHDYIGKLTLMRNMAKERSLSLTSDEERSIGKLADSYMEELAKVQGASDISRDDVVKVLTDQMLIPKLREDIMGSYSDEISESEARVMDISMIVTKSSEAANEAMAQLSDGKDFEQVAQSYTVEEKIQLKVCREDLPTVIADIIFEMEDEALSPVLQNAGRYYIVRCDIGYDIEATAQRKVQMEKDRRRASIGTAYQEYCKDHDYVIDDEIWGRAVELYMADGSLPDIFAYMDED